MADARPPRDPALALTRATRTAALTLTSVAVVAALTLAATAAQNPTSGSLTFELAKVAMQVLAVTVFGAVVAATTFLWQQAHIDKLEQRRDEDQRQHDTSERRAAEKAAARSLEQETWRREVANAREQRERQDELLRRLSRETLQCYNRVKRERRLLRAFAPEAVDIDRYDESMSQIIDLQLAFEELARLAPLVDDGRVEVARCVLPTRRSGQDNFVSLADSYGHVERYLNHVVGEYETHRHLVASSTYPVDRLPHMKDLKSSRGGFRMHVSYQVDDVLAVVQAALAQPLRLPDPRPTST